MGITEFLASYITGFIEATGYLSIFIGMTMESMVFPIPSEAIMPFAGFLINEGKMTFTLVIFWSTLGSILGSLISYAMGRFGGRIFVQNWGKYFLLDHEDLEMTEKFFRKYGDPAIFICRFIPVVRHLISIPAGFAEMDLLQFTLFTTLGAGLWNAFLAFCGFQLKDRWDTVMQYSRMIDIIVLALLAGLVFIYISRHLKKIRRHGK